MPQISFNCSSLIGLQTHYQADWHQSLATVNQFYQPLETFGSRFDAMLPEIVQLGFEAVDIWTAEQLNRAWATPDHIKIAHEALKNIMCRSQASMGNLLKPDLSLIVGLRQ